jgi:hypothetical protein
MFDESLERIGFAGKQGARQFCLAWLVHTLILACGFQRACAARRATNRTGCGNDRRISRTHRLGREEGPPVRSPPICSTPETARDAETIGGSRERIGLAGEEGPPVRSPPICSTLPCRAPAPAPADRKLSWPCENRSAQSPGRGGPAARTGPHHAAQAARPS